MLKEIKQLNKAYNVRFNDLYKSIFIDKEAGLLFFIEYLKYLRDNLVLIESISESEASKLRTASIITAIAEFEAYKMNSDVENKNFHWNNFCTLFKQNMEDWLDINDSI